MLISALAIQAVFLIWGTYLWLSVERRQGLSIGGVKATHFMRAADIRLDRIMFLPSTFASFLSTTHRSMAIQVHLLTKYVADVRCLGSSRSRETLRHLNLQGTSLPDCYYLFSGGEEGAA